MKTKIKAAVTVILLWVITGVFPGYARAAGSPGFTIPVPNAPGAAAQNNKKAVIDYSNTKDGYVMAKYEQSTKKSVKVIVKGPSGVSYTYSIRPGNYEVFPLSDGNGGYTVGVYEQIEGTKYAVANTATMKVSLSSEFAPFLCPNQYVNYNKDSQTVHKAAELSGSTAGITDNISAIYNFIISNFSYDKALASKVQSGYLPNVDEVLSKRTGICFDYAAVMTAMLRSLGIPCKLVVGYAGEVYHAWVNVYSKETGKVNQVISFDGRSWTHMDPTFASSANQSAEIMKYIGNGSNYKAKFMY